MALQQLKNRLHSLFPASAVGLVGPLGGLLGIYVLLVVGLGIYWSRTPEPFDIKATLAESSSRPATGVATTLTAIQLGDALLSKPGGFLRNDIAPPGVFLDNIPNWEYGVLIQLRDLTRAMREVMSRSQSQSREDPDLALAEPRFNFQANSWMLPSSESQYQEGLEYLRAYLVRLQDPEAKEAQFYARADNLRHWLAAVDIRLGSLSQRLSASVGQRRVNTDLAGDGAATQSTPAPAELEVKTPWSEIDDVFYESRGTAWALLHILRAIEVDFADVLAKKNATVSVRQIIRELEATQETVWSPMILNGSGFGLWANHSLVMASYLTRANAAIVDLRDLLAQG